MRFVLLSTLAIFGASAQESHLGEAVRREPGGKHIAGYSAAPQFAIPATWYDTSNRAAVAQAYINDYLPTRAIPLGWVGDVAAGIAGDTSQQYKTAVVQRVNWYRAMAGVPAWITLDPVFNGKAQKGALMLAANRALSHTPPPSWQFYTADGAQALGSSNICQGFQWDPGCVEEYIADQGTNNGPVGHRRWILFPQTRFMGTGDVPFQGNLWNALWIFDNNYFSARPSTRDEFVSWPPKGYVPYQVVFPRWSFSYPNADFSTATVTMTRGGAPVPLRMEAQAVNIGENSIVWVPDNQSTTNALHPAPPPGDTAYNITISNVRIGGQTRSFNYLVIVFDPAAGPVFTPEPPSASFGLSGGNGSFRVLKDPPDASFAATSNAAWISVTSTSGAFVFYAVDPNSGPARTGTISIGNAVYTINQAGIGSGTGTNAPYGVVDTPGNNAAVSGAIGVTGWALDDIQVTKIEVWRKAVPAEPNVNGQVYIGDGIFLEGARPDVANTYPQVPFNTRAGWGMQVLTNMLPNAAGSGPRGNGIHQLFVYAFDAQGKSTLLGSPVINVNNAAATKPFGTLDTPASGATISGVYTVFGWALTPQPATIPMDGSTIWVFVDGVSLGHAAYNHFRPDIATLFPGYNNTNGAVGYFYLDTTTLSNGMHSIAWSVTDNLGRVEGIGSRLFWVNN
jgi:hypothetical protein